MNKLIVLKLREDGPIFKTVYRILLKCIITFAAGRRVCLRALNTDSGEQLNIKIDVLCFDGIHAFVF